MSKRERAAGPAADASRERELAASRLLDLPGDGEPHRCQVGAQLDDRTLEPSPPPPARGRWGRRRCHPGASGAAGSTAPAPPGPGCATRSAAPRRSGAPRAARVTFPFPSSAAGPKARRSLAMERSPFDASAVRSASSVTSSAFPPSCPAKRSAGGREAAADRGGAGAARDGRAERHVEVGREAPALEAGLARREGGERREVDRRHLERQPVRRRDAGVAGSGGAWIFSSRFCFAESRPALSVRSSGAPAASPSTTRSSSLDEELPPARGLVHEGDPRTEHGGVLDPEHREVGRLLLRRRRSRRRPAARPARPSPCASASRWTLVEPSFSRTTATRSPCSSTLRTRTSLPPERSARRSSSFTSARSSSRSGRGSPAAAPMRTASTRTPSPVRMVVLTAPISTGPLPRDRETGHLVAGGGGQDSIEREGRDHPGQDQHEEDGGEDLRPAAGRRVRLGHGGEECTRRPGRETREPRSPGSVAGRPGRW